VVTVSGRPGSPEGRSGSHRLDHQPTRSAPTAQNVPGPGASSDGMSSFHSNATFIAICIFALIALTLHRSNI